MKEYSQRPSMKDSAGLSEADYERIRRINREVVSADEESLIMLRLYLTYPKRKARPAPQAPAEPSSERFRR